MANNNRDRGRYASDENWDQHQDRNFRQQENSQGNYGNVEYDRDRDWENQSQRNRRNYGSSEFEGNYGGGQQRENDQQGRFNQQGGYNASYGKGYNTEDRRNMDQGSYSTDYGYQEENRNYGQRSQTSGGYGNREKYQGNNENRDNRQRTSDRTRNMYGGDTSNYGNANQGSFDRDWWDRTRDEVSSWFGDDDAERRRRADKVNGPHRGKGPKGYQRSDERIKEDVCDRLCDNPAIDATDIEVKVDGAEVILAGTVETREAKRRAEDLAESVSGVTNVQNQLRVAHSEGGGYSR